MRYKEFVKNKINETKVGREFQHLEDLLIVDGTSGGLHAVDTLEDLLGDPTTARFKWDGGVGVFWGRNSDGDFIFVPGNQWNKKQFLNREGLAQEIQSTGRPKPGQDPNEFASIRKGMADKYTRIWDLLERATPEAFRGYINGELMFTEPVPLTGNEYVFTPNKVTYHVKKDGLGGKMATAQVFAIIHGVLNEFGAPASNMQMLSENQAEQFNQTPEVIVINAQSAKLDQIPNTKQHNAKLAAARNYIATNSAAIDTIADYRAPRFSTLKQILYTYAVARAKSSAPLPFDAWLDSSRVSDNQKAILAELSKLPEWQVFWKAFELLHQAKLSVYQDLESAAGSEMYNRLGIRATIGGKPGGEGFVRSLRRDGMTKLVNPEFRSAPANPRFAPEV